MIRKIIILELIVFIFTAFSCGHTHEHTETMKQVIEMNKTLWDDLNTAKADVKLEMTEATQVVGNLDSDKKLKISKRLKELAFQKEKLRELDTSIPSIEGYEPKCNHEPGEPHEHNNIDIYGVPEDELLDIHKELKSQLEEIKEVIYK